MIKIGFIITLIQLIFNQITVTASASVKIDSKYLTNLEAVLNQIDLEDEFNIESIKPYFTESGFEQFTNLYGSSKFIANKSTYEISSENIANTTKSDNLQAISNIDLKNTIVNDDRIVIFYNFYFDTQTKKIIEMAAVDPEMLNMKTFFENNSKIESEKILTDIRRFIERFRTYYEEKNIDEIAKIYSEDAIIITGKRINDVKKDQPTVVAKDGQKYQLTKQNKVEYISNLKKLFIDMSSKKNYLKLSFSNIVIRQHGKFHHVFGVNFLQTWKTRTYSDKGNLFLILDYSNPEFPQIRIRTWMPEDSYNYALYDFTLN